MALVPAPLIAAPTPGRRRYGLFDAASGPIDLPPHGAGGGVSYTSDYCGKAYAYGVNCYGSGQGQSPAPEKPLDGDGPLVSSGVFTVLATMNCGLPGYTWDKFERKLRTRFDTAEMSAVENAFWTGLDFQGNPLGIYNLNDDAEDIDPPASGTDLITEALGTLERYAYLTQGYGYQATIHAPTEVAAFAFESGHILMDGNRKVTALGTIWDFGAYPPGSMVVTGQTTVWRSPDVVVRESMDRETNEALLVAEREYAVAADCFAGRVSYDPLGLVSP